MSKIGRRPIVFSSSKVEAHDGNVTITTAKVTLNHVLPAGFNAVVEGSKLLVVPPAELDKTNMALWGLHRALLANKIKGAESGFEKKLKIVGLGFKAQAAGKKLTFTLGYTHKNEFELPRGVDVEIDKTGQFLTFKSIDKELLGSVCDTIRSFRKPEPYKGTGIMYEDEVIIRKAGKTKA